MTQRTFEVGQTASLSRTISSDDIESFARISGDDNPVHLDEEFAKQTRFGRRIAHGMFAAGLISAAVGTRLPGYGAIYMEQSLRFRRPVFIGDTVTVTVTVTDWNDEKRRVRVETACTNQDGERVVEGEALLWVPD